MWRGLGGRNGRLTAETPVKVDEGDTLPLLLPLDAGVLILLRLELAGQHRIYKGEQRRGEHRGAWFRRHSQTLLRVSYGSTSTQRKGGLWTHYVLADPLRVHRKWLTCAYQMLSKRLHGHCVASMWNHNRAFGLNYESYEKTLKVYGLCITQGQDY